mmetsp:Transcript_25486/g.54155  ORF Transcript_25486/g.54155 Transcript_25486/m.54155 type:complete len:87 (+) Transcript_25486:997-1257(+)
MLISEEDATPNYIMVFHSADGGDSCTYEKPMAWCSLPAHRHPLKASRWPQGIKEGCSSMACHRIECTQQLFESPAPGHHLSKIKNQ